MLKYLVARRRLSTIALVLVAIPVLSISVAIATGPGDSATRQEVTDLVFGALGSEGDMQLGGDTALFAAKFTGQALEDEKAQSVHVQDLVHQGTDYPGSLHISQQKVLSISGSGGMYTIEVQFHAIRDNMKDGAIVDHSVSDVIWQVTVIKTTGGWQISEMHGRFAPGGGP
jgi:hypothetical protein